jgi:hypothetical protein
MALTLGQIMNQINLLLISATITLLLTACTGASLQSSRLDKAESFMIQAEQAISMNNMRVAQENIGTSNAYILTLKDNFKFLSDEEKSRYNNLKARIEKINQRVSL